MKPMARPVTSRGPALRGGARCRARVTSSSRLRGVAMFFRGRQPETSIWRRFRAGADGFTFGKEDDYYAAHIVANAERVVDLFHVLTGHLPPAVDVSITDARTKRTWKGEKIALPDVRESIARMKVQLAASGGVEFAVYSPEDQITLNPQIELFIY